MTPKLMFKQLTAGRETWLILVLGTGLAFLLITWNFYQRNQAIVYNGITAPPLPTLATAQVEHGATLYAQHCATCHGAQLEGKPDWQKPDADGALLPPPHDSSGHTWHHKDDLLLEIILNGGDPKNKSKMPAFKAILTQGEAVAILDFIKSKWGKKERGFQWWMTTVSDQQ